MARIQRVVNTCWLSESLGQIPASAKQRGERGSDRQREGGREREKRGGLACRCVCEGKERERERERERESVPSQRSSIPSAVN